MPLAECMIYVVGKNPKLQSTTRTDHLQLIDGLITELFTPRGMTVASLTPGLIDNFIESVEHADLSVTTQNDCIRLLNTCLRYALRKDHIAKNQVDKADRPAKGKSRAQFYTKRETGKLPECAKGEEIYIPVMLALFYGLRRSEVCGLPRDSIDRENDRIRIDRNAYCDVLREGKPIVITDEIKAESSVRTLPLIPFVKEELLAHRERQEYYRKMFRSDYSKKCLGCVCVDPTGNLIVPDKLTHKFNCLLKSHSLRHIRFHVLRHSCASLLVASGIPLKMVQLYMSHSNYSTTADIYAHLNPEVPDASAACAENLLPPRRQRAA